MPEQNGCSRKRPIDLFAGPCNLMNLGQEKRCMADKKKAEKKAKNKGSAFSSISGAFDAANDATMALGPLTGLAREDFIGAIGLMLRQTAANPAKAFKATKNFSEDVIQIMTGKSDLAPDAKDKRFMDPAWQFNPFFKAGAQ